MTITNFWIIVDSTLPSQPSGMTTQTEEDIGTNAAPEFSSVYKEVPGFELKSFYVRRELWDLVVLREQLQYLEIRYPDRFIPVGAWDFTTGAPVGGVGSPWFQISFDKLLAFMPDVIVDPKEVPISGTPGNTTGSVNYAPAIRMADLHLVAGQSRRQFV